MVLWALVKSSVLDLDGHPAGTAVAVVSPRTPTPCTHLCGRPLSRAGVLAKLHSLHLNGIGNFIQEETHRMTDQQSSMFIGSMSINHRVLISVIFQVYVNFTVSFVNHFLCHILYHTYLLNILQPIKPYFNYLAFKLSL